MDNNKPVKIVDAEKYECKTKYCIPDWLRDEQIKLACARFPDRFMPAPEPRKDPIALVCFGPSLNDTWKKIKDFEYTMSCSGSHKYLRDHKIIPTWHVEVDPRKHKIELIGNKISPKTTYLMASCCHPLVFDHLVARKANIVLWHTYSGEKKDKLPLVYPRGEWVSTGGANVGLRALVLARLLGFTKIHIFGMDGSFPKEGHRHAAYHPNAPKGYLIAQFEGKEYATTTGFLQCAKLTFHELEMLPDTEVIFYGEGLIQDMARKKTLSKKDKSTIAFYVAPTISASYKEQNRLLHYSNATYGTSALNYIDTIKKLYEKTQAKSMLDYGCGKGMLAKNLDFPIWEYDPAIPGKDGAPRPSDLVVCIDVLEHIEPEYLDSTLYDIARCTYKVAYFIVATTPAVKLLPDGRNTHLIQEGKDFWRAQIEKYFIIPGKGLMERGNNLHIVAVPDKRKQYLHKTYTIKAGVA